MLTSVSYDVSIGYIHIHENSSSLLNELLEELAVEGLDGIKRRTVSMAGFELVEHLMNQSGLELGEKVGQKDFLARDCPGIWTLLVGTANLTEREVLAEIRIGLTIHRRMEFIDLEAFVGEGQHPLRPIPGVHRQVHHSG